jgi:hypothetical protein
LQPKSGVLAKFDEELVALDVRLENHGTLTAEPESGGSVIFDQKRAIHRKNLSIIKCNVV